MYSDGYMLILKSGNSGNIFFLTIIYPDWHVNHCTVQFSIFDELKKHLKNYNLKHWIQVNTNGVVPKFNFNLVQTLKLIVMFLFIEQCKDKSQIDKFKQEGTYQLDFLQ